MKIHVKRACFAIVALGLLYALGCVQRDEFRALQGEVRRTSVEQGQQIRKLNERMAGVEERVDTQEMDRGKQLADHLNEFTMLQEEVASLRGQVEELSHKSQVQFHRELEDLKRKLEEQEGAEVPATRAAVATPPVESERETVERVEDLYKEARFSFEDGEYQKSRDMFSAIMQRHPDSALVDNAQFWIGECYFREGNFKGAILEYEKVMAQFPQSPKVPAAFLKQGMAFEKLGDAESARYLYTKITKDFPDSDQAPMAAHRLRSLP
jgi:tol-pal system protein YbgF